MRDHINEDGKFQSDKYLWCSAGFVPLKLTDPMAQQVLWDYAEKRESVDKEFSEDLRNCLMAEGFVAPRKTAEVIVEKPHDHTSPAPTGEEAKALKEDASLHDHTIPKISDLELRDLCFKLMQVLAHRNAYIAELNLVVYENGGMMLGKGFNDDERQIMNKVFDERKGRHS